MIPHERELVERLKDEPFALLGINTDRDKEEYFRKAEEMGVTWRSSWQGSTSGPIPTQWGITGYPTLFLIDHEGVIVENRGAFLRNEEWLDAKIDELVAEAKRDARGEDDGSESDAEPEETFEETFEELEAEYEKAHGLWMKEVVAASRADDDEALGALFEKNPVPLFLPRFLRLADAGDVEAMRWIVTEARPGPGLPDKELGRLKVSYYERLIDEHALQAWIERVASALQWDVWLLGEEQAIALLRRLLAREDLHPRARPAAMGALGMTLSDAQSDEQREEGLALLRRLVESYPESEPAGRARGRIFRVERLQVGMVVPDFETTDVDGVPFELSDYRGKVVLLDFWGFW